MASRRVKVVVASLGNFLDLIVKKVVLDIVANLRAAPSEGGTPVDTGWARANWVVKIGSPVRYPAGTREAAEAGAIPTDSQESTATFAATYTLKRDGRIYISNPVRYITKLNEGSSKQAPAGFVEAAIAKAIFEDLPKGLNR